MIIQSGSRTDIPAFYVALYSEMAKELVNRDKETFFERVRSKMNEDGTMYIHKSTGVVICAA